MSDDLEIDFDDLSRRMDGAMNALRHEFDRLNRYSGQLADQDRQRRSRSVDVRI